MDENMIRLLLKDQADTSEKQAQHVAAFRMQFDALRAELQTTRGLLQTCYGGEGDLGSTLPRSMRLDVPKFNRVDPESWIFSINEYFALLNTPADQRLKVVGFNLEGVATEWLKLNLQRELLVSKPTTLGDAFSLARIIKAGLDDQAAPVTIQASKTVMSFGNQKQTIPRVGIALSVVNVNKPPLLPMPPQMTSNVNTKPLAIKWKFLVECQERLNKCVRGHKCPRKFLLLMADEDDDTVQESEPDTLYTTENNEGSHTFVQPKVGERIRRQAMVTGRPYQWVGGSPAEAIWEWMSDSQSAYSSYHLKGKVNFEGVRNVTSWAVDIGRRKMVKCDVQGSGRRKRKKGVGHGSKSPV
ncbi:hypothetical protein Tco_0749225 [Tanacetum coccineum]|uniref:Uncharacterized protein n=1 Tax=Tanacetum coccineum TaxID=301880 RepID=A0ABQ4YXT2_9ASTR